MHEQIIRFKLAIDKDIESVPQKSAEVIKSEFNLVPQSASLTQINDDYLSKNKDCARRIVSALKARKLLSPDSSSSCENDIAALIKLPSLTFEEAREILELLTSWKSSQADSFRSGAAAKWPKAAVFA